MLITGKMPFVCRWLGVASVGGMLAGGMLAGLSGCARNQAAPDETVATAECPVGAGRSTFAVREKDNRLQVRVTSRSYDQAHAIQQRAEAIALVLLRTEAQPSLEEGALDETTIRRVVIEALPTGVILTFRATEEDNVSALRERVENHLAAWSRRSCQIGARPLEG